jgi:hypothetical protein
MSEVCAQGTRHCFFVYLKPSLTTAGIRKNFRTIMTWKKFADE